MKRETTDIFKKFNEKKLSEADSVASTIGSVIDTDWGGSNDEQMKAVQMLKFLATDDDPLSNKFMKALDKFTSGMKKADFKEGVLKEAKIPKVGATVTIGKKRKQSTWVKSRFKAGMKAKVISYDTLDNEKVLVVSTLNDMKKDDYDPDMDYDVVYVDEVK